MSKKSVRELIIEGANAQILDLAQNGRVVTDKHGNPVLDQNGNPARRQLSAADINAINRYLRETRTKDDAKDGVPSEFLKRLNQIADGNVTTGPIPELDRDGEDDATGGT